MVCAERSSKVAGGFLLVPVAGLMRAWEACRARGLGAGCFRAWLACHEMVARRQGRGQDRPPAFGFDELAGLAGVSERRARASVSRLVGAGLLEWSRSALSFPGPADLPVPDLVDTIGGGRGRVAIPRRMLRMLSGGARPALIATALGILLRCLSRRRGGFDGRGRVKASWIARVFGVDLRRVKAARAELVALGWIRIGPSDQRALNRWGAVCRIDLEWDRAGRRLPPPAPVVRPGIATPSVDLEPLPEREKDQEPARPAGGTGIEAGDRGNPEGAPAAPDLDDIRPEDLRDVGRLIDLHGQAAARGLASPSEDGRLKFVAAAEHARAIGSVNPPGLFARIVRAGLWRFLTREDEDSARRRLREHLHGRAAASIPAAADRGISGQGRVTVAASSLGILLGKLKIPIDHPGGPPDAGRHPPGI
jgi:hypothetical protein